MNKLVDFAWYRERFPGVEVIRHPAGPVLPLVPGDETLVPGGLRAAFRSGDYCREEIVCLGHALRGSDRVLDIGAGLGVTATFAAGRVRRVVAIEADARIVPVSRRLLAASDEARVELIHGLPANGRKGRGPVFLRADFRLSSRSPGSDWQSLELARFLPLNAIIDQADINVIVCDVPFGAADLLLSADLGRVERIVLTRQPDTVTACELDESLAARGFFSDAQFSLGRVTLYRRLRLGKYSLARAETVASITG